MIVKNLALDVSCAKGTYHVQIPMSVVAVTFVSKENTRAATWLTFRPMAKFPFGWSLGTPGERLRTIRTTIVAQTDTV